MLVLFALLAAPVRVAQAAQPVVHAVLFYSPGCPHCHEVMEKVLPPLKAQYGERLDIVGVDVTNEVGNNLYQAMVAAYNVTDDRLGVPTLVVGDKVLVGSGEIPEQLPGIIEQGLAAGGIDFPNIPGLADVLKIQAAGAAQAGAANAAAGVVHAILFYSPDCPHCHDVMENVLPRLKAQYGDMLDIAGIDVSHSVGQALYQAMVQAFSVPNDRLGVPALVVGKEVLIGAAEIPELLPGMIEQGLAAGGIGWPNIAGLAEALAAQVSTPQPVANAAPAAAAAVTAATGEPQDDDQPPFVQKFLQDPLANTLAVIIELLMLAAVVFVVVRFLSGQTHRLLEWPERAIPLMSVFGLGVAGYLSYAYVFQQQVVCGPVGHCNTVQESEYAYLFGVLPVAVLGLAGYLAILAAWWVRNYGPESLRKLATLGLWGMAWFGILFSLYLTFLEPFVIGGSCAWCLTSAGLMTLVFLASSGPAIRAMKIEDEYAENEEEIEPVKA